MKHGQKLKTALDESRLLILGAQVLFGFQFESVFQDLFADLVPNAKIVHCAGLLLLLCSVSLLIAPSLFHQIACRGEVTTAAIEMTARCATLSLLPLTLGLGAATFVVFGHTFGTNEGILVGGIFTLVSLGLLYGIGFYLRTGQRGASMSNSPGDTPLNTRIDQMLTEARVIIPGGQALLGFQLIATLSESFAVLPTVAKYVHAAGLCAVALAVTLLMTPAAIHRIAYRGEDSEQFFRIGSALVIAAVCPLALGMATSVYIVFLKVTDSEATASLAGLLSLLALLAMWIGYPLLRRSRQPKESYTEHQSVGRR